MPEPINAEAIKLLTWEFTVGFMLLYVVEEAKEVHDNLVNREDIRRPILEDGVIPSEEVEGVVDWIYEQLEDYDVRVC